jgi:phytoene synthase
LGLARLAGVRDPRALVHAERLGHAMQMSNIVRDVGEDWRRGRVYIPAEVLARHGVTDDALRAILDGGPLSDAYRAVIEEMIGIAEADYRAAFAWLPALPARIQPCMAAAAYIYRGLHDAVRRNHHDDVRRRARVSAARKLVLSAGALAELRRARLAGLPRAHDATHPPLALPDPVARRG